MRMLIHPKQLISDMVSSAKTRGGLLDAIQGRGHGGRGGRGGLLDAIQGRG